MDARMVVTQTRSKQTQESGVTLPEPSQIESPRGLRAPGTARMIAGSLAGAVLAYLFQVFGGRRLGTTAFAPVALLWTVFFIVATVVLIPLEQFVTREVSRGRRVLADDWKVLAVVILVTALALAGFVAITNDHLFGGHPSFVLQAGTLTLLFGGMQVGKGILAGHRRFADYGLVLTLEGLFRLGAAVAFLTLSSGAVALGWAMVAAPLCILFVRPWRLDRETVEGVDATPARGFLSSYVLGSSASQLLLGGAPLGVGALGGGEALRSIVFVTFTLYRAPLTLIYNLQGRVLSLLVRMDDEATLRRGITRLLAVGVFLVASAGLVGWLVGPAVVELLFGMEFRPAATVAALAAAGVIAGSITQLMGQALVATGSTGQLAGAWVGGLGAGLVTMIALGGASEYRVAVGFLVGELVALGLASWRTLRGSREGSRPAIV
jgi:O-antigen/teichoic acid export membrane protein